MSIKNVVAVLILTQNLAIAQNIRKEIVMEFENCLPPGRNYKTAVIEVLKGMKKKRVTSYHGYCEYRFEHRDGSILYVSTEIYSGSSLNTANRMAMGIDTYAKSRSQELVDTIKNSGKQTDGRYWSEYILGDIVAGYVDVTDAKKTQFDAMLSTLRRKE